MKTQHSKVREYQNYCSEVFEFLGTFGFKRMPKFEELSAMYATVVYVGVNVGFVLSIDVHEQCMDAKVVKVTDGKLLPTRHGGYSSDLFGHLVRHVSYRGSPSGAADFGDRKDTKDRIKAMIDGSARLLSQHGQVLLRDQPDSLPR